MKSYLSYFKELYNPRTFKRKMDYIKYNFSPYIKKLSKANIVILEIGPGLGEFVNYLNTNGITNIDVLDIDEDILEHIKSNYKIKHAILSSDIKRVDRKLRKYDIIFLLQVFEHIPKEQYKTFIQILYKHLKPQGYIIITVPNGGSLLGLSERYNDLQHEVLFTENSLRELPNYCEISNYEIEIKGYRIPPYSLINIIRIMAQKIFHFFLSIIYIVNAGVYLKIYNPNISLIIKKIR